MTVDQLQYLYPGELKEKKLPPDWPLFQSLVIMAKATNWDRESVRDLEGYIKTHEARERS